MKNLLRHNNGRRQGRKLLLAVSILAVAIFGVDAILGGLIRSGVQNVASSIWRMSASAVDASESSGVFTSRQSLARENISLRAQVASLKSLKLTNVVLTEENASLKEISGLTEGINSSKSFEVLSYVDASPYGTFIINGGSAEGVVAGSLVLAEGGVLIGTIDRVGTHSSQVYGILAPGREIVGRIGNTTAVTIYGRGSGNGVLQIPRDTFVEEGDLIYYEAGNLIVGEVGVISSSSADAEKTLFIRVPLNLYGVRFVTVMREL